MTLKTQSDLFTPLRPRPPTALAMRSVPLPDPSGRSGPLASPTEPWRLSPLLAPRDHCCAFPLPGSPLLHREATPDPAPLPASSPCGRRRSSSQRTRGRSSGPLSGATRPAGRTPPGLRTWRGGVRGAGRHPAVYCHPCRRGFTRFSCILVSEPNTRTVGPKTEISFSPGFGKRNRSYGQSWWFGPEWKPTAAASGCASPRLQAARSLAFITGRSTPLLRDAAGPPREPPRGHRRERRRRKQLRAAGPECTEVRGARAPGLRAGGAPGRGLTSAAKRTPSTRCSEPWSSQEPQCRWHCRSL